MFAILASLVEVSENGEKVNVDPSGLMIISAIHIFLFLMPICLIILYFFQKKRLEHKQIMLAIERGTPLSELRPVKPARPAGQAWIRHLSWGLALIIIASGIAVITWPSLISHGMSPEATICIVFSGVGIAMLIRAILERKAMKEEKSGQNNPSAGGKPASTESNSTLSPE